MKKTFKLALLSSLVLLSTAAFAQNVHTWHTISSTDGNWSARLQMINENGSFMTRDGMLLSSFSVSPSAPQDYGFAFPQGTDFDVAYSLTMTKKSKNSFTSPACVFIITASSPANPDVRVSSFHGAKCDWKVVPGVGENFMVG